MKDPQKRLMRMFAITWFILLVLLIVLIFVLLQPPKTEIHNYTGQQGVQGIQGIQGIPGAIIDRTQTFAQDIPIQGPQVTQGSQGIQGAQGPQGAQGDAGVKGEPGAPARDPEFQKDPATGAIVWRLQGDTLWQVLLTPCDIKSCQAAQ